MLRISYHLPPRQSTTLARSKEIVYHTRREKLLGLNTLTEMHEIALPPYPAYNLDAWEKGVEEKSHFLDCLWDAKHEASFKRQ